MTRLPPIALAVALLGTLAPAARAGVILQAAGAFSTDNASVGSPDNTRNKSGLSAGYTSLATDFDAYVASNPTHDSNPFANIWLSNSRDPSRSPTNFDFDLGGTFTLESFALWNFGSGLESNVRGFELLADDDAAFSSPTSLGRFTANPNTGDVEAVLPEVFTFSPTSAAFVRMRITSDNGDPLAPFGFGEAAFEVQAAVPEPGALALLAGGGLGLLGYARRRRAA